ncbi:GGDEF domain-containing protein [Ferviditalea candida]|uniref:GGDEF domain-containing protein n=1 Tax=Ferviditalea candida TaxID=3108399 RepID=A0ABU5ZHC1_9BACL|nr:GGDEF domain-containing protein [Paenibacillaceae bacterium T2]
MSKSEHREKLGGILIGKPQGFTPLDWDRMVLVNLPKRFYLAAIFLALAFVVDVSWFTEDNWILIAGVRAAMVFGALLMGWIGRSFRNYFGAEILILSGSLIQVFFMSVLAWTEGTYNLYITGVYQVLAFVILFLPIRPFVFGTLVFAVGAYWFGIVPVLFRISEDAGILIGHAAGFATYAIMLVAGNMLFIRLRMTDVIHRKSLEDEAGRFEEQTSKDDLTGAFNYRMFQNILPKLVDSAIEQKSLLCLCLIDLDDFKQINDRFGHATGNRVLRSVVHRLSSYIREGDYLFRIGGDEFAIVFNRMPRDKAELIGRRIADSLGGIEELTQQGLPPIRCSMGIAYQTVGSRDWKMLFNAAERALYKAKEEKHGQNQINISGDSPVIFPQ